MKSSMLFASGILVLSVMLASPGVAGAQHCRGVPIAAGESLITLDLGFPNNAVSYGFSLRRRLGGPLALGLTYFETSRDAAGYKWQTTSTDVSYELGATSPVSICGIAMIRNATAARRVLEIKGSETRRSLPIGVAIGRSFSIGGDAKVAPYLMPRFVLSHFMRQHSESSGSAPTQSTRTRGWDTNFEVDLGATFRVRKLLFNAGVLLDSAEDSRAILGFRVGYSP